MVKNFNSTVRAAKGEIADLTDERGVHYVKEDSLLMQHLLKRLDKVDELFDMLHDMYWGPKGFIEKQSKQHFQEMGTKGEAAIRTEDPGYVDKTEPVFDGSYDHFH